MSMQELARWIHDRGTGSRAPRGRLPAPERVRKVGSLARRLLFPEYFTEFPPHPLRIEAGLRALHGAVAALVADEVAAATCEATSDPLDPRAAGLRVADALMQALPGIREALEEDLDAALRGDPAARSCAEIVLCYPGFRAIQSWRIAHTLWRAGAPLLARIVTEQAHARTGIDLHPGATIAPGFFIDHGTGVVVGETAVIGRGVRLYQGVTVGARSLGRGAMPSKRHPTLEDDVVVYANATILGGDTVIGRGAVIGGNSWVTASVAPGTRWRMQDPEQGDGGPAG